MRREELDLALRWSAEAGRNPGLRDADALWAADPQGFWMAEADGEPVASLAAVAHGGFGFVGLYFVRPDRRGQGLGRLLWRKATARLAGLGVGLYALPGQVEALRGQGFTPSYELARFCWDQPPDPCVAERLVPLEDVPLADVAAYDRIGFPGARAAFLRRWLAMPNARGLAVAHDGELLGYGVVRTCWEGSTIGPLFAEDCDTAETLLLGLGAAAEQLPVFLDMPVCNVRGVRMAERWGMREVSRVVRMDNGPEPDVDLFKIFGLASLDLG
jgi:GNAT superfamily N-acetyltransferase